MDSTSQIREKQRLRERHAVLCRPKLGLLPTPTLVNFCRWKWARKMRRWGPRPRRDQDIPKEHLETVSRPRLQVWFKSDARLFLTNRASDTMKLRISEKMF